MAFVGKPNKPGQEMRWDGSKWIASSGSVGIDAFASRPTPGMTGSFFVPVDSNVFYVDNGSQWLPFGPVFPLTTPPPSSSFTWVNQGSAFVRDSSGSVSFITDANGTGNNRHLLVIGTGSLTSSTGVVGVTPPYTLTVGMILQLWPAPNPTIGGLAFRESSTGKFVEFILYFTVNTIHMATDKFTNPTTSAGAYDDGAVQPGISTQGLLFLRIQDDGSNLNFYWSQDGTNFQQWLSSRSRTDFMTTGPDQVGLVAQSLSTTAAHKVMMNVLSWKVTTP